MVLVIILCLDSFFIVIMCLYFLNLIVICCIKKFSVESLIIRFSLSIVVVLVLILVMDVFLLIDFLIDDREVLYLVIFFIIFYCVLNYFYYV